MRRLYLSIYVSMLVAVFATGLTMATLAAMSQGWKHPLPEHIRGAARMLTTSWPAEVDDALLEGAAGQLGVELALYDGAGALMGSTLPRPPRPCAGPCPDGEWFHERSGFGARVRLDDGRLLVGFVPRGRLHPLGGLFFGGTVLLLVMAVACYPVARRLTGRLEAVREGVSRWGAGALDARAPVAGSDEIATLARTFNQAADRVAALVRARQEMLAGASHELRSPLARLRMALAFFEDDADEERRRYLAEALRDIGELDALVEDLLVAARLEVDEPVLTLERLEVTALVVAVASRFNVQVQGQVEWMQADRRLLQRLFRNLLDNAQRYGGGADEVSVERRGDCVLVSVSDRGPGIPEELRERVFEPFFRGVRSEGGDLSGTGLGLALVQQIATAHGGAATARERTGGGVVFEVALRCPS
jgi:signal transduction histidine kinase